MVRLTKEQQKILKRIAKGKYIYPDAEYDTQSKAWQNLVKLTDEKLIEYEVNPDGGSCYKNFTLTIDGRLELEAYKREAKKDARWWVTTAISMAALILSISAIVIGLAG